MASSILYRHLKDGSEQPLLDNLSVANSFFKRMKGLLGISTLDGSSGIVITPCNLIHTFGMKFNIDVIFLDKDNRIINIRTNVPKSRVHGQIKAKHTMELTAGSVERLDLTAGDQLMWR